MIYLNKLFDGESKAFGILDHNKFIKSLLQQNKEHLNS